jgi:hypothetical protein
MKKKWVISLGVSAVAFGGVAMFLSFTFQGHILGLYAFAAIKAPLGVKIDCVHETNQKVAQKFTLPLAFDEGTKNDLREFWHFSYYRACLFRAGYDFYGNTITPSEITTTDSIPHYVNHFMNISFAVPVGTTILTDNQTDPDIDDYVITSKLQTEDHTIIVQADRSYKEVSTLPELEAKFTGFSTTTATLTGKTTSKNQAGTAILAAHQENGQFGFISLNPQKLAVTVYGEMLPAELLAQIESSFTFTK